MRILENCEIIGFFIPKKRKKGERVIGKFDKMEGYWMAPDFQITSEDEFPIE